MATALRERFGITRLAETTRLQRIEIATWSAIVPAYHNFSVFSGKGLTSMSALVGALMEAIERQAAAEFASPSFEVTLDYLRTHLGLDEHWLREPVSRSSVPCTLGYDLLSGEQLLVPLELVQFPWRRELVFKAHSTNGLASGNNLLEAVYHGLFEVVERHVWSLVHLRSHVRPALLRHVAERITPRLSPDDRTDLPVATEVSRPTGNGDVDGLTERIGSAGLGLRLLGHQESELPVAMFAAISESATHRSIYGGMGCSWSPAYAAVRALTEAVSSRAIGIQGAREDVVRPGDDHREMLVHIHGEAAPPGRWYGDGPATPIEFPSLSDLSCDDMLVELQRLVDAVRKVGARRILVVDVTPPQLELAVARVIVPEFERTIFDLSVSPRAQADILDLFP